MEIDKMLAILCLIFFITAGFFNYIYFIYPLNWVFGILSGISGSLALLRSWSK
jgi:uncharacterized membrane protein